MENKYNDPRWQKIRLKTMKRDKWKCVNCGEDKKTLHVHHKKYKKNIWDANPDDLQTLCNKCHEALGRHPKAGVWWEAGVFTYSHCPLCGGEEFKDTGVCDICVECGHKTVPEHFFMFISRSSGAIGFCGLPEQRGLASFYGEPKRVTVSPIPPGKK